MFRIPRLHIIFNNRGRFPNIFLDWHIFRVELAGKSDCYSGNLVYNILHGQILIFNLDYLVACLLFKTWLPLFTLYSFDSWLVLNSFCGMDVIGRHLLLLKCRRLLHTAEYRSTQWVFVTLYFWVKCIFLVRDQLQSTLAWVNYQSVD